MRHIKHKDGNIHNNEISNLAIAETEMVGAKHTPGPWACDEDSGTIYYADGDVEPTIAMRIAAPSTTQIVRSHAALFHTFSDKRHYPVNRHPWGSELCSFGDDSQSRIAS